MANNTAGLISYHSYRAASGNGFVRLSPHFCPTHRLVSCYPHCYHFIALIFPSFSSLFLRHSSSSQSFLHYNDLITLAMLEAIFVETQRVSLYAVPPTTFALFKRSGVIILVALYDLIQIARTDGKKDKRKCYTAH